VRARWPDGGLFKNAVAANTYKASSATRPPFFSFYFAFSRTTRSFIIITNFFPVIITRARIYRHGGRRPSTTFGLERIFYDFKSRELVKRTRDTPVSRRDGIHSSLRSKRPFHEPIRKNEFVNTFIQNRAVGFARVIFISNEYVDNHAYRLQITKPDEIVA